MERGIREFLEGLMEGETVDGLDRDDLLARTPPRVAATFADDLLVGTGEEPERHLEPIDLGAKGPVLLENIRFTSVCAHHLLPYRGVAHVGFLPGRSHVGLGGVARLVDTLARRLTLQESLTSAIADHVERSLVPRSVVVQVDAEHLCLSVRGARKTGHRLVTREERGERAPQLEALLARLDPGGE